MRNVRAALIQAQANMSKQDAVDKHIKMIADAAGQGAQVVGLQEIFHGPYFCAEQDPKWYDTAEPEDGPTVARMREVAREHGIVLIVPWYEEEQPGVYYNSACVIDRDGTIVGKYRKTHIPHVGPCFWEKFYFKPGNLGYPVFRYLWELEQPAHAVANGFWMAASNRVGVEAPLNPAKFYGSSYFCSPRGKIIAQASDSEDEVLVADLDLDQIREVRNTWQFFRDRRPETYGELVEQLP